MTSLFSELRNLKSGFLKYEVWVYLAYKDIRLKFHGSTLGFLWIFIQHMLYAVGAGLIWSILFDKSPFYYIPFIASGFAVWGLISACFIDGSITFVLSRSYIHQIPIPLSVYVFRMLTKQLISMLIVFSATIILVLIAGLLTLKGLMFVLLGFILLVFVCFSATYASAYLGSRFRDLQFGFISIFQFLFVVTPIIYPPDILIQRGFGFAVYMNPFTSLIEIIRTPMLEGRAADLTHYVISIIFAVVFFFVGLIVSKRWRHVIAFWL